MSIRKNDIGTYFRWTVYEGAPVDISAATTKQVKFIRPDLTQLTKALVFSTKSSDKGDGTDGRVEYVGIAGDLNQKGTYRWALYIVMPGWTGHGLEGTFTVDDVLF